MLVVVEAGSPALKALLLADASAGRPSHSAIRVIEIPIVDATFFWVTGKEPVFVDQMVPKPYDQSQFMAELARRLDNKRRFKRDPKPAPDHGPRSMSDDGVVSLPEQDTRSELDPDNGDAHSSDDPEDTPSGNGGPGNGPGR